MRVLMVNSDSGAGSTGVLVADLYRALEEGGHSCLVGYGRENALETQDAVRIGTRAGVYRHALVTRLFDSQGFSSRGATKAFLKAAEMFSPDIVHLHNLHGSYLHVGLLFEWLKASNLPVVWTLHDCWPFTGHCANYAYVGCDRWKTGCFGCPQKSCYPKSALLDRSRQNYARKRKTFTSVSKLTLTAVSEWLSRQVSESFLKRFDRLVIPNGVDLGVFRPTDSDFKRRHGLEGKTVLLGAAGVWSDRKGLPLLAEIARKAGGSFRLVLVGVTEKQKKSLPSNVVALGRVGDPRELSAIYSSADVFVNASAEETFGLVSLEALACGTPVVTNRLTANPELVDGSCGAVADDLTAEAYLRAIRSLLSRPPARESCLNRARRFDKRAVLGRYLELYRQILLAERGAPC